MKRESRDYKGKCTNAVGKEKTNKPAGFVFHYKMTGLKKADVVHVLFCLQSVHCLLFLSQNKECSPTLAFEPLWVWMQRTVGQPFSLMGHWDNSAHKGGECTVWKLWGNRSYSKRYSWRTPVFLRAHTLVSKKKITKGLGLQRWWSS